MNPKNVRILSFLRPILNLYLFISLPRHGTDPLVPTTLEGLVLPKENLL